MADDKKMLYPCDPSKNKECNKHGCFINGGPCRSTTHAEYCDAGDLISRTALTEEIKALKAPFIATEIVLNRITYAPTIEAEPTFRQIKEYCRKCDFVVVDGALFNEMKSRWSAELNSCEYWDRESHFCALRRPQTEPIKHGKWVDVNDYHIGTCSVCGSRWGSVDEMSYCPTCGVIMDEAQP